MNAATIKIERMNATEAKNRFGDVLEKAANNTAVSLMKHGKVAAYVISPEMYERLNRQMKIAQEPLEQLERDFDEMVARMQSPESLAAARSLMTIDAAALRASVRRTRRKSPVRG